MGADLLLGFLWTTQPEAIDFDKAADAIAALTVDDLNDPEGFETDLEIVESLTSDDVLDEWDEAWLATKVRPAITEAVDYIRPIWNGVEPRDALTVQLGPVRAFITGGESWGDDPSDTWTTLMKVPDKVWEAIGFYK